VPPYVSYHEVVDVLDANREANVAVQQLGEYLNHHSCPTFG
jgi:hypothetical protein